jgi:hypothetical protein
MSVEKAQRESAQASHHWDSAKRDPLAIKKNNKLNLSKPLKLKILTGKEANVTSVVQCGQCDQYKASLVCVECKENYCNVCFIKFHHKGSLAKHHVRPLYKAVIKENYSSVVNDEVTRVGCEGEEREGGVGEGGALLVGSYDEARNAASFQEALNEWRMSQSKTAPSEPPNITTSSCGVQAVSDRNPPNQSLDIQFTASSSASSYYEKLLLKKFKKNPSFYDSIKSFAAGQVGSSPTKSIEGDEEEQSSLISPYNIFYGDDDIGSVNYSNEAESRSYPTPSPLSSDTSAGVTIEEIAGSTGSLQNESKTSLQTYNVISFRDHHVHQSSHHNKVQQPQKKPKKREAKKTKNLDVKLSDKSLTDTVERAWRETTSRPSGVSNDGLSRLFMTYVDDVPQSSSHDIITDGEKSDVDLKWNSQSLWSPANSRSQMHIDKSDLPPPSLMRVSQPQQGVTDDSSSDDDHGEDDNGCVSVGNEREEQMNDFNDDEDESTLRDLACELAASLVNVNDNTDYNDDDEEGDDGLDEERAWSRMTIDELVQEFDMYQDSVRLNDD